MCFNASQSSFVVPIVAEDGILILKINSVKAIANTPSQKASSRAFGLFSEFRKALRPLARSATPTTACSPTTGERQAGRRSRWPARPTVVRRATFALTHLYVLRAADGNPRPYNAPLDFSWAGRQKSLPAPSESKSFLRLLRKAPNSSTLASVRIHFNAMNKHSMGLFALAAAFFLAPAAVFAQTPPAPSPAPTASAAAQAAAPPQIPSNFDPCGGPLELLNKIGNGTACVFVRGEGAVTAQYETVSIPANAQINFDTPLGSRTLGLSTSAHAFGYPASTIYVGVLPRAQIAITPPSFVQINSSAAVPLTGSNLLAAGASDMKFEYKQLAYVNLQKFTMAAIDLVYDAPTGSPRLRGAGPSYTIDPIITQPLPKNFGLTIGSPIINSTATFGNTQRGWAWTPQVVPYWQSPGGTLLAVVVQHNFNPDATPLVFSAGQLLGRHLEISAAYGGLTYSASATGPFRGLVNASATAYPSLFTIGINYLIGHSDLPAALQQ